MHITKNLNSLADSNCHPNDIIRVSEKKKYAACLKDFPLLSINIYITLSSPLSNADDTLRCYVPIITESDRLHVRTSVIRLVAFSRYKDKMKSRLTKSLIESNIELFWKACFSEFI